MTAIETYVTFPGIRASDITTNPQEGTSHTQQTDLQYSRDVLNNSIRLSSVLLWEGVHRWVTPFANHIWVVVSDMWHACADLNCVGSKKLKPSDVGPGVRQDVDGSGGGGGRVAAGPSSSTKKNHL